MVFSVLRFVYQKGAAGRLHGRRLMSTTTTTNPSKISPWLMLPPTFDKSRGGMVYNFYSLADDEVLLLNKYGWGADPIDSPDDDARVVGSSYGWLALMNRRNNDLFLSNPLSGRHIKLPPVEALPYPEINLRRGGRASVSKVILSASPDDGASCRVMMSFGPGDRLAFCRPGCSKEWTPIGDLFLQNVDPTTKLARVYEDFVYSSKTNLFNCLTLTETVHNMDDFILEDWDLRVLSSPKIDWIQKEPLPSVEENRSLYKKIPEIENYRYKWLDEEKKEVFRSRCSIMKHLVYAEATDELFVLFRYNGAGGRTTGFIAARVEKEEGGKMRLVGSSLEGLALFVGTNHSFAVAAKEFPHLKPNSIYFTDNKNFYSQNYQGEDVGIFDCSDGTFSSCYYPFHETTIVPPPIWFTPSLS